MSLANRMAIASPNISTVTVEATEFPDLAHRFGVQGVPRTVVNRAGAFVGALPEQQFVAAVLELAGVDGLPQTEAALDTGQTSNMTALSDANGSAEPAAGTQLESGAE